MSTRAHIRVQNEYGHISLYCHCDGYPSGLGMVLKRYLSTFPPHFCEADWIAWKLVTGDIEDDFFPAHVIQPTTCLHGDEAYVYVVDADKRTVVCYEHYMDETFEECCVEENKRVIREHKSE